MSAVFGTLRLNSLPTKMQMTNFLSAKFQNMLSVENSKTREQTV